MLDARVTRHRHYLIGSVLVNPGDLSMFVAMVGGTIWFVMGLVDYSLALYKRYR